MSERELFATGDLLAMSGLAAPTFDLWVQKGVLKPLNGVEGKGNHRVWGKMQAVGLMVAVEMRRSDRGCALPFVAQVVEAFEELGEGRLRKQLAKGLTRFLTIYGGRVIMDGPRYEDTPDVAAILRRVEDHQ